MINGKVKFWSGLSIGSIVSTIAAWMVSSVLAGVSCSVPFNLQNGTVADASQVMANYNALIACLANAAAAGSNNDITAILGLTTPLAMSEGGTPIYVDNAAQSSGTNTITIASTVPNSFTLSSGKTVLFEAGANNTGPATLNVNSTGATTIVKNSPLGQVALAANDIVAGNWYFVIFNGVSFTLQTTSGLLAANATAQSFSGGISITSFNNGNQGGGGTLTVNCGLGPLQFFSNTGAFTLAADSNDGSCDFLDTNSGTAGAVSFSGFSVGANTGDSLDTTNTHKFIIHSERINGTSTYMIKALQ